MVFLLPPHCICINHQLGRNQWRPRCYWQMQINYHNVVMPTTETGPKWQKGFREGLAFWSLFCRSIFYFFYLELLFFRSQIKKVAWDDGVVVVESNDILWSRLHLRREMLFIE